MDQICRRQDDHCARREASNPDFLKLWGCGIVQLRNQGEYSVVFVRLDEAWTRIEEKDVPGF